MGFEPAARPRLLLVTRLLLALGVAGCCWAVGKGEELVHKRHTERSAHFLVHTDLPQDETSQLLERMEEVLEQAGDYWRRLPTGLIECYVVEDLKNWPDGVIPHPMAALIVDRIGGVTFLDEEGAGIHARSKVFVLSSSRLGVAEHEAVHAYCGQTFGVTGPAWYREGIAQVFAYGHRQDAGVHCPPEMLAQLKAGQPKAICDIVRGQAFAQQFANSLVDKLQGQQHLVGLDPVSNWNEKNVRELDQLKEEYAWSWLACHLLYHNPNYGAKFKALGQNYLGKQTDTFGELFGPVIDQLAFEYEFTLRHFELGYRVDLCRWDWNRRFRCAENGRSVSVKISAARGYQASGLRVNEGHDYQFATRGSWQTDPLATATNATGDAHGRGRLEGILLRGYRLSEPFELSAEGKFRAPGDGLLYLRCRDDWSQLGDNDGSIVVVLGRAK